MQFPITGIGCASRVASAMLATTYFLILYVYIYLYKDLIMKVCASCPSPAKCKAAGKCLKASPAPKAKMAYGGMAKKATTKKK